MNAGVVPFPWVFKHLLNEDKKPPADVTDYERNELCWHNSKSGRNYAKAKLIRKYKNFLLVFRHLRKARVVVMTTPMR
ncbi:hypothetical protein [Lysinibacillus sphaericus]|uniref:hypothetical protein n=1 Tax=Lysinibacillus sphaericus TaxID=1421 RepID=UPI001CBE88E5|nr:hypothetical protein [Lysinibacillus sphaericus]